MNSSRFVKTDSTGNAKRIKSLEINNDAHCEFFVRLYALFGEPNQVMFEGFTYKIHDTENDVYFSADLTGFGAGYFAKEDDAATQKIIREFEAVLYDEKLELKPCSMTYEHDFGQTTYTYDGLACVCTHEYDE